MLLTSSKLIDFSPYLMYHFSSWIFLSLLLCPFRTLKFKLA